MPLFKQRQPTKIPIQQGYDLWAAHYSQEVNPIKSASDESVKRMLPDLTGKTVIDAGCGAGYFCLYAEQAGAGKVIGIDFSEGMIAQAKLRCKRTTFILGEIQNLPSDQSSDVIICALVLGHLKDIEPALAAFAHSLTLGGVLVLTDFHPILSAQGQKRTFQVGKKAFEIPHHLHPLTEYSEILARRGFTITEMVDRTWKGMPIVFAINAKKSTA